MLPRSVLPFGHNKPGVAAPGLHAPSVPAAHYCIRSPCAPLHAAATDVAPASAAEDLLRAAAAVRARQQQADSNRMHDVSLPNGKWVDQRTQQQEQHEGGNFRRQHHSDQQQDRDMQHQLFSERQQQQQQRSPERQQQRQRPGPYQHMQQQYRQRPSQQQQYRQHPDHQQPQQQQRRQQQGRQPLQQQQDNKSYFIKYELGSDQDWSLPTGLAVTWLGTSSGTPTKERNISCTLVRTPGAIYMVDCGEGSHRQARKTGLRMQQVDTIFITHLHGDHCFGIGSMLVSLCNVRRAHRQQEQQPQQGEPRQYAPGEGPGALRLVGPPKLGELLMALLAGAGVARLLDLPVYVTEFVEEARDAHGWQPLPGVAAGQAFIRRLAPQRLPPEQQPPGINARLAQTGLDWRHHPYNTRKTAFEAKPGLVWRLPCENATVTAAQLQHRVPCWGYVFDEVPREQQQQQADGGAAAAEQQQDVQQQQQQQEQPGDGGRWGSGQPEGLGRGRRILILGDTVDSKPIAPIAYGADLVSHEATFADGMEGKAAVAQHSTAWMAGQFADAIEAKSLVLTHFSARYEGSAATMLGIKQFGVNRPGQGAGERRLRSWEVAQMEAEAKAAEERAVKALQREAEEYYSTGPVLLAMDLFSAHLPAL